MAHPPNTAAPQVDVESSLDDDRTLGLDDPDDAVGDEARANAAGIIRRRPGRTRSIR